MNHPNPIEPAVEDRAEPTNETSFAEILSQFEQEHSQERAAEEGGAQSHEGVVVALTADGVFLDIGRKMEGVLAPAEFLDAAGNWTVQKGDKIIVAVTGRDETGTYRLSTIRVERPKDWSGYEKAFAEKTVIAGTVEELRKGGFRVNVGVPAFMPASRSGAKDQADMEKLVGQEIRCRIIKLDTADEDVVVDRRAVLEEEEAKNRQEAFASLQEGAVVSGRVRTLTEFGAFVELAPGVDGLLHVSDLAWHRVAKPADVLSVGDEIPVKILKLNPTTRKISLGTKQLLPDPWTETTSKLEAGQRITGKVVRLTDFGAFVELAPGVDGLIHLSELSWSKKVKKPSEVVAVGEMVEVVVLGVNQAEKRIALGLKQALGDPWEEAEKKFLPGAVVEGPVVSLTKFGAFVDLGNGIEGMVHIGDISHEKRLDHPKDALTQGQTVKAQVLDVDRERKRIRLGIKQLEPTSADQYISEHKVGETVTGRVVSLEHNFAKVELGEGVFGFCPLAPRPKAAESDASAEAPQKTDISALTAMLSARWKQGGNVAGIDKDGLKPGQVRSFRIAALDAGRKRVELESAG